MSSRYLGGVVSSRLTGINQPPPSIEYVVVGGGGGGASALGGGGGAGGYLAGMGYPVTVGSAITISIGSGGAGATGALDTGSNGNYSEMGGVKALPGGGGQANNPSTTQIGVIASAGGGGRNGNGTGLGTPGQGSNAGAKTSDDATGSGGGGAGSPGTANSPYWAAGMGGCGVVTTIMGFPVQLAGGGPGGTRQGTGALQGVGFGPAGASTGGGQYWSFDGFYFVGQAAMDNTGSGGGGTSGTAPYMYGGNNGGSGIVIIRYPAYFSEAASTTGSPAMFISGPWRVYRFLSSGSITF